MSAVRIGDGTVEIRNADGSLFGYCSEKVADYLEKLTPNQIAEMEKAARAQFQKDLADAFGAMGGLRPDPLPWEGNPPIKLVVT